MTHLLPGADATTIQDVGPQCSSSRPMVASSGSRPMPKLVHLLGAQVLRLWRRAGNQPRPIYHQSERTTATQHTVYQAARGLPVMTEVRITLILDKAQHGTASTL